MALIEKKIYQLPKTVTPLHYDVYMKPMVEKALFEAEVNIRVKVHEPVNEICLHAHKLSIKDVVFKFELLNKSFKPEKTIYDAEHHMVRFNFGHQVVLPVGYGVLHLKYEGHIVDHDYTGFYFNRWGQANEWEKFWLMTSFENFKAHYAIPCFDEPWAKATWKFQFDVPKMWNVVFNTPSEKNEVVGDWRRFHFHQTPILHPGSIGFTMGVFDRFEHTFALPTGRMMKMNIYHPKFEHYGTMKMADHAQVMESGMFEMMEKIFKGYFEYFNAYSHMYDAQFPLEKVDFVAVPNFDVNGAGYYGLINMHYDHFWFDKVQTDVTKMVDVASIMAMHIGRHYFGHYLNFNNWNYHYLQESFVTFFKYMIVDRVFPEYHIWETRFIHDELIKAMKYDQLPSTMPLDWTDKFATFNKTIFDQMFFNGNIDEHFVERMTRFGKGSVVIRMIRDYVTPKVFDQVMMEVMHKYQFRAVEPEEFWTSFEFAAKKPVVPFVQSWMYKEAFPIVHITGKMAQNGDYLVTLKQENVLNYYKNVPSWPKYGKWAGKWNDYVSDNAHKHWHIPMMMDFGDLYHSKMVETGFNSVSNTFKHPMMSHFHDYVNKEFVLDREEMTIAIPAEIFKMTNGYFKIAPKTVGYCVFHYPEEHVRKWFMPVKVEGYSNDKIMSDKTDKWIVKMPVDHMRLMHDCFTLWKVGVYSPALFFEMIKNYVMAMDQKVFHDYSTMRMIVDYMFELRQVCIDTGAEETWMKMQKFAVYLVKEMRHMIKQEHYWNFEKDYRMSYEKEQLVGLLAHFLVVFKDQEMEKHCVDTFWKWFKTDDLSKKPFVKDLHKAMFVAAAHTNEPRVLEVFFKLYQEFYRFPEAKDYVIYGLGFFTNKTIVEKIFQWLMSDHVLPEDKLYMMKSMMKHYPVTRDMTFGLFKNKYDFFGKFYNDKFLTRDFFGRMPFYYSNDKKIEDVMSFIDEHMPVDVTGKHYWLNQRFANLGYEHCHMKNQFFVNNQKMIKEFVDKL